MFFFTSDENNNLFLQSTNYIKIDDIDIGGNNQITLKSKKIVINDIYDTNGDTPNQINLIADEIEINDIMLDQNTQLTISPYTAEQKVIVKINAFEYSSNNIFTFQNGDFYMGYFIGGNNLTLNAIQDVAIYLNEDLTVPTNSTFNSSTNDACDSQTSSANLFLYSNEYINVYSNSKVVGLLYSQRGIETEEDISIKGALWAKEYMELAGNNKVCYDLVDECISITLLSPDINQTIGYNYTTLEIADNVSNIKARINDIEYIGVKNGSSFFIYNIPLQSGENTITLIADDGTKETDITLNSEFQGFPPVNLSVDKREGFEQLDVTFVVNTSLEVDIYMLDINGDGIIDYTQNNNSFDINYTDEGRYIPMVTVKTTDGILYSSQKTISIDIKAKPPLTPLANLSTINAIDMQIFDYNKYYILSSDNNIYEINTTSNDILNSIPVSNLNNAEGFFIDIDGNIFIANTGNNQIIKLSKANNYQQTMVFGTTGSGNAQFNQPKDLVVQNSGEKQIIYVLDSGNNRIQVFNYVGAYLYQFDGSTTPTGKLSNPTSMIGYFSQPLTIVDSGNGVIRTLQCTQGQPEHEVSVINSPSSNIGKITMGNRLIVPDKTNKKILFYQNNYWLKKSIDVDKTPNIVISRDGLSLIVASDDISGIENMQIQMDPQGAEPIDMAKAFVQALIDGDRNKVEELLSYDQNRINLIYSNQTNLNQAIALYSQITTWSQTYHNSSYATVKAHIQTATDEFDATFELTLRDTPIVWIVRKFF